MPFDPAKPAPNSPNSSAEMRAQLNALNDDLQQRATAADIANLFRITSSNSNAVEPLALLAEVNYSPQQLQDVINKLDELITVLRR